MINILRQHSHAVYSQSKQIFSLDKWVRINYDVEFSKIFLKVRNTYASISAEHFCK